MLSLVKYNVCNIFRRSNPKPYSLMFRHLALAAALLLGLFPGIARACACGCGVFEVGTASLFPMGSGGQVWVQYEYMDQYITWHAKEPASAIYNNDKYIRTNFMEFGGQYMFNRNWGVMLEVPYWVRDYKGAYQGNTEDIHWYQNNSIGDIRVQGMYTGLSEDMSTGLLMGVKVPSGDWHYPPYDRDLQIGTGSTDLLFGAYHLGTFPTRLGPVPLTFRERPFNWFAQADYDLPIWGQDDYVPGKEIDGALEPTTTSAKSPFSRNSLRCSPSSSLIARAIRARMRITSTPAIPVSWLLQEARSWLGASAHTRISRSRSFRT